MSFADRTPHYLTELRTSRQPRYHVALDTEAQSAKRGGVFEQRWLCAVASFWRTEPGACEIDYATRDYQDPDELWEHVTTFAPAGKRTVVWCHGLAYDLRISGALRHLPTLGYRLEGIVLERTSSWASFKGDKGGILFCDLASWLPGPLARIAADLGMPQTPVDFATATADRLLARCRRDVAVTREAVIRLLQFLEVENLGPFRPTGAGQSHAAYRRRFLTEGVLVHDDPACLEMERVGMYTGRAEAWRHGECGPDLFTEYDLRLAYAHIARDCQLPAQLTGRGGTTDLRAVLRLSERFSVLAEVSVVTDVECVPAPLTDRVMWPIGEFVTVLWDPELRLLAEEGATVKVRRYWLYRKAPVLAVFASWVLERLHPEHGTADPVERRLLKHWSRTLVGRMALRYRRWEEWATADHHDLTLGILYDADQATTTELLQVGRTMFELAELAEADSSVPQVTGWVMSEARARLWRLMRCAGLDNLYYVDTDSLIVNQAGAERLHSAIMAGEAWTLTEKGTYTRLVIRGPRNLDVENGHRIAGVPRKASRVGPLDFEGEVWRSLRESVVRGELDSVVTTARRFRPDAPDPRRRHIGGGRTAPNAVQPPTPPGR